MLVIKKKNLVLLSLVVLLIATGYLNFIYNQNLPLDPNPENCNYPHDSSSDDLMTDKLENDELHGNVYPEESEDNTAVTASSFFINYRLDRKKTREEEIEYIKTIIDNPNLDDEMKQEAQAQILEIANKMEKEMAIENLIRAKNFNDVVVILNRGSVNVIVDKAELKPEEVAQILSIVKRESGERVENITIMPKL